MNRRDLLRYGLSLGATSLGSGLVLPQMAYGSPTEDRYFIFCWFRGGWDILLSLDPRDPQEFSAERSVWTRIETGYELLANGFQSPIESSLAHMTFGPYIGDMVRHAEKMSVIRGMSMETLGHVQGMRRFLTGKEPIGLNARGSSVATVLADLYGAGESIPNLCMSIESYNDGLSTAATGLQIQGLSDLTLLLTGSEAMFSTDVRNRIDQFLQDNVSTQRSKYLQQAMEAHKAARTLVDLDLSAEFDFAGDSAEMSEIRDAFELSNATNYNDAKVRAAMAAKALTGGLSRCVSLNINPSSLDTHDDAWIDDQGPRQQVGFDAIAKLVDYLQAQPYDATSSWLDHTTIVGFSEFSRTAMLNARGGRDHSLTNCCFLLGAGIRPGTVIGASSDLGMGIQAVDLTTGELDEGGEIVRPEHIHRALLESIGYSEDVADLRVDPLRAILQS